ncbi:MAG: chromosome segregation SMC family protein [Calditerrivibrio sp.]|uniref:chromosome segregation SMC family protein n=1 Tax=Calditerrivibrio sp. TaxID=2792612 RepID=UPI003D09AC9E
MKFKKLIIQGFKSFVDKTVIDFPDGITCIVGPNGSGKSNILDAIRWILGEQNPKELRGSDMDDIIFAGSEKRSQSNVASVTLVISDISEELAGKWGSFSEIEITRKYYRDGEREYFINNKRCKLKDIREIFFDTGLGARSISIIEQGKVEKIISASPEEIRVFFDEAAGITRFKEKKKDAEKRLEQAKENLNRVKDIISEVKEKYDALYLQVEKLKNYRELKIRRDLLDKTIYAYNYHSSIIQYQELLKKNDEIQIKLSSSIYEYENLKKQEQNLKDEISKLETELRDKNNGVLSITEEIGGITSEVSVLQNNITTAENAKQHMNEEINSITNRLRDLSLMRESIVKFQDEIKSVVETKRAEIAELENTIEELVNQRNEYKEEIDVNRSRFLDITEKISKIRSNIIKHESEMNRLNKDISRLENEKSNILGEISKIESLIADLKIKKEIFFNEQMIIQDSYTREKEIINKIDEDLKSLSDKLSALKVTKSTRDQQLKLIEAEVKKQSYGDELSRYFDENELSLLLDYEIDDNIKKFFGDVVVFKTSNRKDVLDKLKGIKTDLKFVFEEELDYLNGRVSTFEFERIDENILRINGIYYKSGSLDKAEYIIGMKKEIVGIKDDIKEISNNIAKFDSELNEIKKIKNEKIEYIKNIENQLKELDKSMSNIDIHIKNNNGIRDNLIKREITIKKEINFCTEELKKIEEGRFRDAQQLEELSKLQKELEEEYDGIKSRIDYYDDKIEESKEQLSDLKVEYSTQLEKLNSSRKEQVHIDKEITSATTKMHHLKDRLTKLMTVDINNWMNLLKINREKLNELEKNRLMMIDEKRLLEQNILDKNEQLKSISSELEDKMKHVKKIEQEFQNIKIRIAQIKTGIENLENRYLEKFNLPIRDEYTEFFKETINLNELKNELLAIENRIEEIGPLNMAADQEYLEIEERFRFLSGQKEDIENAIEGINGIIDEIDAKTIESFRETFLDVRKYFKEIFKILFGDGKAEISLANESDILNTGVEIFVQPPGKRLQNMTLLSGGEKAMTACVLLFAMFLYKPSPFCFLDEIDAPLDDANIGRFTKIVQELSSKAQFVIITHNQKTMEVADYLYGVTMQEPGVSKIVSVKMGK